MPHADPNRAAAHLSSANTHENPQHPPSPPSQTRRFSEWTPQSPNLQDQDVNRRRVHSPMDQEPLQPLHGPNPLLEPSSPTRHIHSLPLQLPHQPARIVGGSRHAAPRPPILQDMATGHGDQQLPQGIARQRCSSCHKDLALNNFDTTTRVNGDVVRLKTCNQCRARNQRNRRDRANARQDALVDDQLNMPPPELRQPQPQNLVEHGDPESAISPADKALLEAFRSKMMAVKMEYCTVCREEWFKLDVKDGVCKRCKKSPTKFTAANNMDPGIGAPLDLPELTQMEELMISPIHAMIQLWQVRGGQTKYTGHTCNFFRDVSQFHNRVPLLPEECEVIIIRRRGLDAQTSAELFQDFKVSRRRVEKWLRYLQANHPSFKTGTSGVARVEVDYSILRQLPEDGDVTERMGSCNIIEVSEDAEGPPEQQNSSREQEPVQMTGGCVPNLNDNQSEFEMLRGAAHLPPGVDQLIVSHPPVRSTPINEHMHLPIAIDAFPTLFPTGMADFSVDRSDKVSMSDWAQHLMQLKGGRFARHPRFRYWALNTIMRHDAKAKARWYCTSHPNDRMAVDEIRNLIETNEHHRLAQRVSRAAGDIDGTRPFWQNRQKELTAQIRSPECGTPSVFFTASSADIQWPDLHQHMPGYDINSPEAANSYRTRAKNLNNNPALAAFYFQMRWELFFEEVLSKKFKIKDYWWRYEWQHRGSSHIHGFLWIEDAPSVDNLNFALESDKRTFINYWDQHISTWHPNRSSRPAAVHPSAQLFETLQDTKQELAEMLNRFQRHDRCTEGYCAKRRKAADGTEIKYCRFGFPFDERPTSEILRPLGKDFQEFHTKRNDPELNPYNPTFILGWRANIDIRPVLNRKAVISYVAKYASKGETKSAAYQDMMKAAITSLDGSTNSAVAYQKMLSAFVGERDISGQEVSHIIFGCGLVRSSRRYRNLPVMMELTEEIDFENAALQNTALLKHYLERKLDTQVLRELTLWEFAQHYDWRGTDVRRRGQRNAKPYVVWVWPRYLPDQEDEEQYEKFCYAKMILHHPFSKTEGNTSWQAVLKGRHSTWKAAYQEICLNNPSHRHPVDPLPNASEVPQDLESSSGEDIEPEEELLRFQPAWMRIAGEHPNQQFAADISNLGRREQDNNFDWVSNSPGGDVCHEASRWLSDQIKESPNDDAQDIPENVDWRTLKGNQQLVFLQVMAYMKYIHDHPSAVPPAPLRINVDGTAGTGKSWLIWSITQAIRELFGDQQKDLVARLAPTGIAAYGIRGWTINSGLAIPMKEPRSGMYSLNSAALNRAQSRWKDIKLVILDEKSMIGRAQFGRMDRRLRQIRSNPTEIFGNIPIVMFGDFAQLPPVGDSPLYSTSETRSTGLRSLRMEGLNAYRSFNQSITLTTIHRQAGTDLEQVRFREALMRLRSYNINQTDYELFSSRFWDHLSPEESEKSVDMLHLMPTKDSVNQYNHMCLARGEEPVLILPAKHNSEAARKASDEEAEGLHAKVLISIGASVMLTRNIWTSKGLVNGARGTVKAIWFSPGKNPRYELPTVIWVEFPEYNGPTNPRFGQEYIQPHWVPLTPSTARWENRGDQQLSRTQYPLITAWAITIHKSQGLTLDEAVIELGPADFSPGLAFVALSRIKTLKGLAIRSACGMARFAKPTSDTARMLAEDNERRQVLEQGFQLNEYGVDLSYWKQGFI